MTTLSIRCEDLLCRRITFEITRNYAELRTTFSRILSQVFDIVGHPENSVEVIRGLQCEEIERALSSAKPYLESLLTETSEIDFQTRLQQLMTLDFGDTPDLYELVNSKLEDYPILASLNISMVGYKSDVMTYARSLILDLIHEWPEFREYESLLQINGSSRVNDLPGQISLWRNALRGLCSEDLAEGQLQILNLLERQCKVIGISPKGYKPLLMLQNLQLSTPALRRAEQLDRALRSAFERLEAYANDAVGINRFR